MEFSLRAMIGEEIGNKMFIEKFSFDIIKSIKYSSTYLLLHFDLYSSSQDSIWIVQIVSIKINSTKKNQQRNSR